MWRQETGRDTKDTRCLLSHTCFLHALHTSHSFPVQQRTALDELRTRFNYGTSTRKCAGCRAEISLVGRLRVLQRCHHPRRQPEARHKRKHARTCDTHMAWRGNAHTHVVAHAKHGAAAAALHGSGQVCARSRRLTVVNHELFDEVDVCEQHASTAVALEPQPLKCLHLRPLLTGRPVLDHFEEVPIHVPHGLQPPHARSVARRRG